MPREGDVNMRQSTSNFSVIINNTCLVAPSCAAVSKYRAIDGSCNSLTITNLGQSFTDYRRFTTPNYTDVRLLANPIV